MSGNGMQWTWDASAEAPEESSLYPTPQLFHQHRHVLQPPSFANLPSNRTQRKQPCMLHLGGHAKAKADRRPPGKLKVALLQLDSTSLPGHQIKRLPTIRPSLW